MELGGQVAPQHRERPPAGNAAPWSPPARLRGIRPALVRLFARHRVAAQLVRHSGGRGRGPLQELEGLPVLVQRPAVPANMAGADKAKPVTAEMTLDLVIVGVVRELAERREVRGAVWKTAALARIRPNDARLRRGHPRPGR